MKVPPFAVAALLPFLFGPIHADAADKISVTITQTLEAARPAETIAVPWSELVKLIPDAQPDHLLVRDAAQQAVPSQFTNFHPENRNGPFDDVLFQHDFAAGEKSAVFTIEKTPEPVAPYSAKVFARYVPERLDDFAWENDRITHRMYGPGLDTPAAGKSRMISSGIDVWCKRVRYPVVDRWYLRGHDAYHQDNGEGLDLYGVDTTRGCGGTGIWDGETLHVSHNWKTWKVLANGPIRTVFELGYEPWDASGVQVAETKRFTVDAGTNLEQVESTFTFAQAGKTEITVAVGLGKLAKLKASEWSQDDKNAWLSVWQTYPTHGQLGCGVVLSPDALTGFAEDKLNRLILTKAKSGEPVRYFLGAAWDAAGDFKTKDEWNARLTAQAARLRSPVKISLEAAK